MYADSLLCIFFFFNDTATTEIYTLSLHDALPISVLFAVARTVGWISQWSEMIEDPHQKIGRSEEHTSELQSQSNLVCRLLLEKKKKIKTHPRNLNISRIHRYTSNHDIDTTIRTLL